MPRRDRSGNIIFSVNEVIQEIHNDIDSMSEEDPDTESSESDSESENVDPRPRTRLSRSLQHNSSSSRSAGRHVPRMLANTVQPDVVDHHFEHAESDSESDDDQMVPDVDIPPNNRPNRPEREVWVPAKNQAPAAPPVFTGNSGCQINCEGFRAINFFRLFFTTELVNLMVIETNRYAQQYFDANPNLPPHSRSRLWVPVSHREMEKFIGLCLLMGIVKKPQVNSYWSIHPLIRTPSFGFTMSRDRFLLILKFFHLTNNAIGPNPGVNRLYKVQPLLDHLETKFQEVYVPPEIVSVDESLLLFKGRLLFKQYIPLKRSRFGIKVFLSCALSGYTNKFRVYQGREEDLVSMENELPADTHGMLKSEKIVIWLLRPLLEKGYKVYMDNWYTSSRLFMYLFQHGTLACGTTRANRVPAELRNQQLQKGQLHALRSGTNRQVLAVKYKDKKDVYMMSTLHDEGLVRVQRGRAMVNVPTVINDYNKNMGGVDKQDQVFSKIVRQLSFDTVIYILFLSQAVIRIQSWPQLHMVD